MQHLPVFQTPDSQCPRFKLSQCPLNANTFCSRDAVKCSLWLELRLRSSLCSGVKGRATHARIDSLRSNNRRWSVCHRPSWGIVWMNALVGRCRWARQTRVTRGTVWVKGSYLYRSQLSQSSHFSSCLTVLTFATPQLALLDAAQGALSVVEWPQL